MKTNFCILLCLSILIFCSSCSSNLKIACPNFKNTSSNDFSFRQNKGTSTKRSTPVSKNSPVNKLKYEHGDVPDYKLFSISERYISEVPLLASSDLSNSNPLGLFSTFYEKKFKYIPFSYPKFLKEQNTKSKSNFNGNKKRTFHSEEDCDTIILNNKMELNVKVTEVTTTEIKYKRCDTLPAVEMSISTSEVFLIKYHNGTEVVINQEKLQKSAIHQELKTDRLAVHSFISGIMSTLFNFPLWVALYTGFGVTFLLIVVGLGGVVAIIFGIISLVRRKKYKGKGWAIVGLILGFISLGLIFGVLDL